MLSVAPPTINGDAVAQFTVTANGELTWTSNSSSLDKLDLDPSQIICILPSTDGRTSHLICSLSEDATNAKQPYRLSILRTSKVSDELLQQHALDGGLPSHLQCSPSRRVHVVVSTKSGTGLAFACWEHVVKPLVALMESSERRSGAITFPSAGNEGPLSDAPPPASTLSSYQVLVTESAQSMRQFARARRRNDNKTSGAAEETIVLLSGDGGIVDLLNGADEAAAPGTRNPIIALLPLGTGNALFHSLHRPVYREGPSPLVAGLRTLLRGKAGALPMFKARFSPGSHVVTYADPPESEPDVSSSPTQQQQQQHRQSRHETPVEHLYGAIVASYGFHASLVWESDTPAYRQHGEARFGLVAQELLRESHGYACTMEVRRPGADPDRWERLPRERFGYVLATLASNLERGFVISPDSVPLGDQLRVVHFGDVGGKRTTEIMQAAYRGGAHVGMRWREGDGTGGVGYDEIEGLRVKVLEEEGRWRVVCVDGVIVEVPRGGEMVVEMEAGSAFGILVDPGVAAMKGVVD